MRLGGGRAGTWSLVVVTGILATACGGTESPAGGASTLQLRAVEDVVPSTSPDWDATELTCPPDGAAGCLADRTDESVVVLGADETEKYVLGPAIVDDTDVLEARAHGGQPASTGWSIDAQLSPEGSDALASATRASVGDRIAIVVDGLVISAPTVAEPITAGVVVVAGGLSENEAERLASSLGG